MEKIIKDMMAHEITIFEHSLKVERRMRMIPDFIDTTKDKQLWDLISGCNDIILDLIDNNILTLRTIVMLSNDFKEVMNYIEVITEPSKFFYIQLYFVVMMEYVVEYCEGNELFEACANIKKFESML